MSSPPEKPRRKGKPLPKMKQSTIDTIVLDKAAAECVEELLLATGTEGGKPWFSIIRSKMATLNNSKKKRLTNPTAPV